MKSLVSFLTLMFVSLWAEFTHNAEFNLNIKGPRLDRILENKALNTEVYDFKNNAPSSEATIKLLESMALKEETDIVLIKHVTEETKELIKRTYGHKYAYVYDKFSCGDALVFSCFEIMSGNIVHINPNVEQCIARTNTQYHSKKTTTLINPLATFFSQKKVARQQNWQILKCKAKETGTDENKSNHTPNEPSFHGHCTVESKINDHGDASIRGELGYTYETDTVSASVAFEGSYNHKSNGEHETELGTSATLHW